MDLDHVAIGLKEVREPLFALVGKLGARIHGGGLGVGFRSMQVRLGRFDEPGMNIELLEPWQADRFDFLARFLDRHGDGPHHMTFKVEGIRQELERLRSQGIFPVNESLDNPWWREAFILPKQAHGTVAQVAESMIDPEQLRDKVTEEGWGIVQWWPAPPERADVEIVLRRVVLGVADLAPAVEFYEDVMLGRRTDEGDGWVHLGWPRGGAIKLEQRPGQPSGIDRLECEHDGPRQELAIGGARFVLLPPTS